MSPVAVIRAAVDESRLVRVARRLFAAITTAPAHVPAGAREAEFDDLIDMLASSSVGRIGVSIARAIAGACQSARVAAAGRTAADAVAALGSVDRARVAGIAILAAALTDLVVTPLDPRPVSAARWSLWVGALVVGMVVTARADSAVAAWRERRGAGDRPDA